MTDELVAFLRARLDEDEEAAREATSGPWRWRASSTTAHAALVNDLDAIDYDAVLHVEHELPGQPIAADAAHIARWDPARALAEVQAKRRIIDQALRWMMIRDGEWGCCHEPDAIAAGLCPEENPSEDETLRLLASPYADHPDYRAEWSPDAEVSDG